MQRRRPAHDTTMNVLFLTETAGNFTQALGVKPDMSPHLGERASVAKTIFVDGLMHDRHAIGLSQQDRKRLLPVRHKAWVYIGLQGDGHWRAIIADKADAFIIDLEAQAHFRERV